jgi:hypothetical protein
LGNSRVFLAIISLIITVSVIIAGLTWINHQLTSSQDAGSAFLIDWIGIRSLLTEGVSPYAESLTAILQASIQERQSLPDQPLPEPLDNRIRFPLFTGLFIFPFALISNFTWALAVWMAFLEFSLIILVIICLRLTNWQRDWLVFPLFFVFVAAWYHTLTPLLNGDIVILVALMIGGCLLAIRANLDEIGGILLAVSFIKPETVGLFAVFTLIWAAFQRRWRIIFWFFGALALLIFGGIFFIQDWPLQYLRTLLNHPIQEVMGTPGAAFSTWWPGIGSRLGWVLTALVILILVPEWWIALRRKEFSGYFWAACLTLTLGQWIGIPTSPANYIILLIPWAMVLAILKERYGQAGRLFSIAGLIFILGGLWWLFLTIQRSGFMHLGYPIFLFPFPFFLLIGLYWVRWWSIRPRWSLG